MKNKQQFQQQRNTKKDDNGLVSVK